MKIIAYSTEEERIQITDRETAAGCVLVAVSNITEGNFLGFTEPTDPTPPPVPQSAVALKLQELEAQNLAIMEGIATIYENQLAAGGTV